MQCSSSSRSLREHRLPFRPPSTSHVSVYCSKRVSHTARISASSVPLTASAAETVVELSAANFHPFLKTAGKKLVVVDYFTDWCGPCKYFYPKFEKMASEYAAKGVLFARFNVADESNKSLATELGVKGLPTFHLFRNGKKEAEVVGPKELSLRRSIAFLT